ncbi:MAG: metallophosphoesterase [Prevotella sp.]|nr:metallophosphoesterase [Prevotella sp.]
MSRKTIIINVLCLIALGSVIPSYAQTKIAVMSDIHVMAPELVVNDGTAWQNALGGERKLLDYSAEIYDVLIEKYLADKPDMLLITGDLTKDGELASHQYVLAGLDRLRKAGIAVYVIPGNHDRGTNNAYIFDGDERSKAEVADAEAFESMYHDYGYNSASVRESTTLTYVCEPVKGMVLIGIDSGNGGSLTNTTLSWVCQQAKKARSKGKQVIAMMHHPLFPHVNNLDKFMGSYRVDDYENVKDRLTDAGIHVILTGHVHVSDIAKDYNTTLTDSIYDINTGSTISYPCDYRELTLSKDMRRLTVNTGHVTTLPSNEDFSNTAKSRLQTFAHKYASSMFGNELFVNILTNMIIIHAEGNENRSINAKSLINMYKLGSPTLKSNSSLTAKLSSRGMTWDDAEATLYSMLKDLSWYGVEGHENQTNDLKLTVNLPDLSPYMEKLRGDIDHNGEVNIADVVALLNIVLGNNLDYDFDVADVDANGAINISDIVTLLGLILEN